MKYNYYRSNLSAHDQIWSNVPVYMCILCFFLTLLILLIKTCTTVAIHINDSIDLSETMSMTNFLSILYIPILLLFFRQENKSTIKIRLKIK